MSTKSGIFWVTWANAHAQNSTQIEHLAQPFRAHAEEFIASLTKAGAIVEVSATKRSSRRAYLFHWSWKIALGKCTPSEATPLPGVDIQWDHGDQAASKRGALEMVDGFGLAIPPKNDKAPSTTSNHISGMAIDMNISWTGALSLVDKAGKNVVVTFMPDVNANRDLHAVGASYGVRKLATDAPHWSFDGH